MQDIFRQKPVPLINLRALGQAQWGQPPTQQQTWGGGQQPTPIGGGGGTTAGLGDGPTEINVTVFEPQDLKGFSGANVDIYLIPNNAYNPVTFGPAPNATGQTKVAEGKTDSEGKYFWKGQAPSPSPAFGFRIVISGNFQEKQLDIRARAPEILAAGPGFPSKSNATFVVCPPGTDSLVCAVAEAQIYFTQVYTQQLEAWHYESSGRPPQIAGNAGKQARAAVTGILKHPKLAASWDVFSWWIGDLGIPPRAWPRLIDNYNQTMAIFNAIPFPKIPEAEDLFQRCASGIPLWKGMGVSNPRFFISNYFPRENHKIEADMAASYLINLQAVVACMVHKIEVKARSLMRKAKFWQIAGMIATVMLAPMAGGASVTVLATEAAEFTYSSLTGETVPGEVSAIATAGVSVVAADPAAMEKLIASGIDLLLKEFGEDLNPVLKKIISGVVPKIAAAGVSDLVTGSTTLSQSAASGAGDFISLTTLGSAAAGFAVKMVGNMITAVGVRGVKDFMTTVLGMEELPNLLVPFMIWAINILLLDKLFDAAAKMAADEQAAAGGGGAPAPGAEGGAPIGDLNTSRDVLDPLINRAEQNGVEVPSSATKAGTPVISGPTSGATGLLALTGVGVGAIVVGMLASGVIGGK